MFCFYHKWQLSKSLDTGKPPSRTVHRHLLRCGSCREFYRVFESLESGSRKDLSPQSKNFETLQAKIMSSLHSETPPKAAPTEKPSLFPVLTAAFALLVLTIGLYWMVGSRSRPSLSSEAFAGLNITPSLVADRLINFRSPLEDEYFQLKQKAKETTEYLVSCLDIKIGPEED